MRPFLPFLALALLLGLAGCKETAATAEKGEAAPALAALDEAKDVVDLSAYRGKVVLLNFWRAECGPCLREMPEHEEVYQALKDRGFEILAINAGQSETVVRGAGRRLGVTYPLLSDELEITARRYRVVAVPTLVLIDQQGVVREWRPGPMPADELEEKVVALLGEGASS
ncbi:TlpA disulfide reductase family protein [Afifella sp. IM 167]|uniref:TlpA family protein disulfide reductase n=1 Tax=Afifella sp. IM 167 TaxID=2033586 RepID=UPI001CCA2738|nr:TlpA disulfide reductase family protein [Afifella sp. IM 167]MBZ8131918.1 thioredoxin [Afifella sp. IM 167]